MAVADLLGALQAFVGQAIHLSFRSCSDCGYEWVQLESTPAFLVPGTVP